MAMGFACGSDFTPNSRLVFCPLGPVLRRVHDAFTHAYQVTSVGKLQSNTSFNTEDCSRLPPRTPANLCMCLCRKHVNAWSEAHAENLVYRRESSYKSKEAMPL
eukprot:4001651-Amphidinium_carterae.1